MSNGQDLRIVSSVKMKYVVDLQALLNSLGYNAKIEFILTEQQYRRLNKNLVSIIALRLCTYLLHPVIISIKAFKYNKSVIVIATSNSFINPMALLPAKKVKCFNLISYIYDLHPEASFWSDKSGVRKFLFGFGRLIQGYQSSHCDKVVLMEKGLLEAFRLSYPTVRVQYDTARIMFERYRHEIELKQQNDHRLTLHYGGQLGRMHNPLQFADFINLISKNSKHEFDISIPSLNHHLFDSCVNVVESRPFLVWEKFMLECCDIGIVSLSELGSKVCFPSKMLGYINYGVPILALCPKNSDLSDLVIKNSLGWVIHWDLPQNMHKKYMKISCSWEDMNWNELRKGVLSFRDKYLDIQKLKEDWKRILT